MPEAVVLGDLELDRVTGLVIDESRKLAVHRWPGNNGDIVQDMGMASGRIWLSGVAIGPDAGARLEQLRTKMQAGSPLDFVASAAVASNIEQVMVAALRVTQPPGRVHYFEYQMELVHYVPPPPPAPAGFDLGALGDIAGEIEAAAASAVDQAASALGDALEAKNALEEALAAAGDALEMVETIVAAVEGLGVIKVLMEKAGAVIVAGAE